MLVYKDILPFENLQPGHYFGGRTLLAISNLKNIKRQVLRQTNNIDNVGVFNMLKTQMLKRMNKAVD
jgi:hypothetical protein